MTLVYADMTSLVTCTLQLKKENNGSGSGGSTTSEGKGLLGLRYPARARARSPDMSFDYTIPAWVWLGTLIKSQNLKGLQVNICTKIVLKLYFDHGPGIRFFSILIMVEILKIFMIIYNYLFQPVSLLGVRSLTKTLS